MLCVVLKLSTGVQTRGWRVVNLFVSDLLTPCLGLQVTIHFRTAAGSGVTIARILPSDDVLSLSLSLSSLDYLNTCLGGCSRYGSLPLYKHSLFTKEAFTGTSVLLSIGKIVIHCHTCNMYLWLAKNRIMFHLSSLCFRVININRHLALYVLLMIESMLQMRWL